MRARDWKRCEASYGARLPFTVHWTDPADSSSFDIPDGEPVRLQARGRGRTGARGAPVRRHPLLLHGALRSGGALGRANDRRAARHAHGGKRRRPALASSPVRAALRSCPALRGHRDRGARSPERAIRRGVDPGRIAFGRRLSRCRRSCSPRKDRGSTLRRIAQERSPPIPICADLQWGGFAGGRPYFGVYGKLGENKGSFALLAAMSRLKRGGPEIRPRRPGARHGRRSTRSFRTAGRASSASPVTFCSCRFFRTGACPSSYAAASRCAASSRISRSAFTPRSSRHGSAPVRSLPRRSTESFASFPALRVDLPDGYGLRRNRKRQRRRGTECAARRDPEGSGSGRGSRRARQKIRARSAA